MGIIDHNDFALHCRSCGRRATGRQVEYGSNYGSGGWGSVPDLEGFEPVWGDQVSGSSELLSARCSCGSDEVEVVSRF